MSFRNRPARSLSGLSLVKSLSVILFLLSAAAPLSGEPSAQGGFRITSGLTIRPTLKIEYPAGSDLRQGLMINRVLPDSKAKGILLPGDIIKGIKGTIFTDWQGYYRIMSNCFPDEIVPAWIIRNGEKRTVRFPLDSISLMTDFAVLTDLLVQGQQLRLAVIVSGSENSTISDPEERAAWTANRSRTILATEEASYLGKFSDFDGFSLVDRSSLETIMEEQRLGLSGLIVDPARIGELSSATHIMDIRLSTIQDRSQPRGFLETITRRLIEVESGHLIATVVVETN